MRGREGGGREGEGGGKLCNFAAAKCTLAYRVFDYPLDNKLLRRRLVCSLLKLLLLTHNYATLLPRITSGEMGTRNQKHTCIIIFSLNRIPVRPAKANNPDNSLANRVRYVPARTDRERDEGVKGARAREIRSISLNL